MFEDFLPKVVLEDIVPIIIISGKVLVILFISLINYFKKPKNDSFSLLQKVAVIFNIETLTKFSSSSILC